MSAVQVFCVAMMFYGTARLAVSGFPAWAFVLAMFALTLLGSFA